MERGKYKRIDKYDTTNQSLIFDIRKIKKNSFINDGWLNHYRLDDC